MAMKEPAGSSGAPVVKWISQNINTSLTTCFDHGPRLQFRAGSAVDTWLSPETNTLAGSVGKWRGIRNDGEGGGGWVTDEK